MYVLIAYDVTTLDGAGASRLRKVAKLCERFGQRVQYSLFECLIEPADYEALKYEVGKVIDQTTDSVRFYNLGSNWHSRVDVLGHSETYDPEGVLCI